MSATIKCPPCPIDEDGIKEFLAALARAVASDCVIDPPLSLEYTLFEDLQSQGAAEKAVGQAIPCGFWDGILSWSDDVQFRWAECDVHGTEAEQSAFLNTQYAEFSELRGAIQDGWNALHPNLRATWSEDASDLVIRAITK
jgi:hypothetical protein